MRTPAPPFPPSAPHVLLGMSGEVRTLGREVPIFVLREDGPRQSKKQTPAPPTTPSATRDTGTPGSHWVLHLTIFISYATKVFGSTKNTSFCKPARLSCAPPTLPPDSIIPSRSSRLRLGSRRRSRKSHLHLTPHPQQAITCAVPPSSARDRAVTHSSGPPRPAH